MAVGTVPGAPQPATMSPKRGSSLAWLAAPAAVLVLVLLFRHSAVVRDTAMFVFSVPLVIGGWLIGRAIRNFLAPDAIITNGLTDLVVSRLFWSFGIQAIGSFIGLFFAIGLAAELFPPTLDMSNPAAWAQYDGRQPSALFANKAVQQQVEGLLSACRMMQSACQTHFGTSDPSELYNTIIKNTSSSGKVHVLNLKADKIYYVTAYGCSARDCKTGGGALVAMEIFYGSSPPVADIFDVSLATADGSLSTMSYWNNAPPSIQSEIADWATQFHFATANQLTPPGKMPDDELRQFLGRGPNK